MKKIVIEDDTELVIGEKDTAARLYILRHSLLPPASPDLRALLVKALAALDGAIAEYEHKKTMQITLTDPPWFIEAHTTAAEIRERLKP